MTVLDLFCGLGGFSQPFRDRGHRVVGVDRVPPCDVQADILDHPLNFDTFKPDVILASPPCTDFSRDHLPWIHTTEPPSTVLVQAVYGILDFANPTFWILENVVGAVKYLGPPTQRLGSRYLWGSFPLLMSPPEPKRAKNKSTDLWGKEKWGQQSSRDRKRSRIPYSLALTLCTAIERSLKP